MNAREPTTCTNWNGSLTPGGTCSGAGRVSPSAASLVSMVDMESFTSLSQSRKVAPYDGRTVVMLAMHTKAGTQEQRQRSEVLLSVAARLALRIALHDAQALGAKLVDGRVQQCAGDAATALRLGNHEAADLPDARVVGIWIVGISRQCRTRRGVA